MCTHVCTVRAYVARDNVDRDDTGTTHIKRENTRAHV